MLTLLNNEPEGGDVVCTGLVGNEACMLRVMAASNGRESMGEEDPGE